MRPSSQPTGNFNHRAIFVTHSSLIKEISMASKDGWEVVSASPLPNNSSNGYSVLLLMKKPMYGGMSVNDVHHLKSLIENQMNTLKDEKTAGKRTPEFEAVMLFYRNILDFIGR